MEEVTNEKKNTYYYNQVLEKSRKKKSATSKKKNKTNSFSSQTINLEDYLYVPEGMEFIVYTLYLVLIPYIFGIVFLFFAVAGADFNNFMLLDLTHAFIVWTIGYEIVATLSLTWIFVLFMKYDSPE